MFKQKGRGNRSGPKHRREAQRRCVEPAAPHHLVSIQLIILPGNLAVSMSVPEVPPLSGFTAPLDEYFVHPGDDLAQERGAE